MRQNKTKVVATKRPSKLELRIAGTVQDYIEQDGEVIRRQRNLLNCQVSVLEDEIADFGKRIADARRVKTIVEAQLIGLDRVKSQRKIC